jgi:adenosylmethionine-8-amino-7-oxononanoate aminotransferase
MTDLNKTWVERDLRTLWHPCTQMKDHEQLPLIPIRSAEGLYLEDFNGKRYLDAIGSWWVNLFGHCHPVISAAVKDQLDKLEHVMLAGFTHEPVIALTEKLLALAPAHFKRCFYTDNGSSSVEVALKMSYHFWHNQGKPKKRVFMTLDNSYHGETLGALSVTQVGLFKNAYADLLTPSISLPVADTFHQPADQSDKAYDDAILARIEKIMEKEAENTCALIVEPLVQCAAGMRMYRPYFLEKLFQLTRKFEIHLIADEIATGFGRTGTMFASEQATIQADFMTLSKGITGGYLPLAVVLTTEPIYQVFYDDYASGKSFLHSHTYTGNPLACRAALATLDLLASTQAIEKNRAKTECMRGLLAPLQDHPKVAQIRQAGMITAIERVPATRPRWSLRVHEFALSQGVLLRPIGQVIYFMPAYIIEEAEMKTLVQVAQSALDLE